jgi:hypothetical protein
LRKGRREKLHLTLPEPIWKAVEAWIAVREKQPGLLLVSFDRAEEADGRLPGEGRHTAITAALEEAGRTGTPIEEVLASSGHSRQSLSRLLRYRDNLGAKQGEIARRVAGRASSPEPPQRGIETRK